VQQQIDIEKAVHATQVQWEHGGAGPASRQPCRRGGEGRGGGANPTSKGTRRPAAHGAHGAWGTYWIARHYVAVVSRLLARCRTHPAEDDAGTYVSMQAAAVPGVCPRCPQPSPSLRYCLPYVQQGTRRFPAPSAPSAPLADITPFLDSRTALLCLLHTASFPSRRSFCGRSLVRCRRTASTGPPATMRIWRPGRRSWRWVQPLRRMAAASAGLLGYAGGQRWRELSASHVPTISS
jgi:hypothetical protein